MRLKFYKRSVTYASQLQRRSTEKFVSRIDPEAFSASGSRVIFPVACRLRLKALATKRGEEFHLTILNLSKEKTLILYLFFKNY